jgi:hypothetical protein
MFGWDGNSQNISSPILPSTISEEIAHSNEEENTHFGFIGIEFMPYTRNLGLNFWIIRKALAKF